MNPYYLGKGSLIPHNDRKSPDYYPRKYPAENYPPFLALKSPPK